jgi:hypothetical protein
MDTFENYFLNLHLKFIHFNNLFEENYKILTDFQILNPTQ